MVKNICVELSDCDFQILNEICNEKSIPVSDFLEYLISEAILNHEVNSTMNKLGRSLFCK